MTINIKKSVTKNILAPDAYIVGEKLIDNAAPILARNIIDVNVLNENISKQVISIKFITNINIGIYIVIPYIYSFPNCFPL